MASRWLTFAAMLAYSATALAVPEKPKFAKGDCVQRVYDVERWETPEPIIKILEVGIKKYRTTEWSRDTKSFNAEWDSHAFIIIDAFNSKVRCPK
jgi:hypothetical protein